MTVTDIHLIFQSEDKEKDVKIIVNYESKTMSLAPNAGDKEETEIKKWRALMICSIHRCKKR